MARHKWDTGRLESGFLRHITSTSNTSFHVELSYFDDAGELRWKPNPDWQRWLETHDRFSYDDRLQGHFTARRETRRNTFYWYAFGSVKGKTKKVYIGGQHDVNLGNLATVSRQFKQARTAEQT